jgi:hypothetical protein
VLNQGYNARGVADPVTPCDNPDSEGFVPAAGFLRTAFHDVVTGNVGAGTGGLDASVAFELEKGAGGEDNSGPFVKNTLGWLQQYYSAQASMADLIALSVYTGVRGCGGPAIPLKSGRKDATGFGGLGVPKVGATRDEHIATFARLGFNTQEMIKLVACGHTLGGVHPATQAKNFVSQLRTTDNSSASVAALSDVENFDTTHAKFDAKVAQEFVSNTTTNPLVVGTNDKFNSDKTVFNSDGGRTIRQMADEQTFQNECRAVLSKMLNIVPAGTKLTEDISVYDVKPGNLALTLGSNGTSVTFSGEVRVRTNALDVGDVALVYKTRSGVQGNGTISTTVLGQASGWDDSFTVS